ncbi:thiol-disulfide oxidoreductase DCC family protein [Thalassotalea sediminis]|uniref:thiol-disulfide oxidoreductase DCC family protein n=1 Tax=Thalassotalea sediminis TaxID=1759089 RepID=UPI0025736266|nr:DUF393 domain-containing protein [Thalassotalea sediminis]
MNHTVLTIFYDGQCPLCCAEMDSLKRHDKNNAIKLVNLHQAGFATNYPRINKKEAMQILHGEYQGETLKALAVTHRAWTLVGKGLYVAPLTFPIVKQLAHVGYLFMAKYRHPVSSFFHRYFGIGKAHCENGTCSTTSNSDHRRK